MCSKLKSNYFLPFRRLSFHLAYSFLCCAKPFKFNQVPFVYFLFPLLQEVNQKRSCCDICPRVFCLFFLSVLVPSLTFRSLIHFEFIFVYGVRKYSNFILLHVAIQFPTLLIEKTVFSPLYILPFCHRLVDHRWVGLSLGFLSYPIDLYFCFCASTILS